ncbi:MAG: hypothetical protein MUP19_03590 [Candidatus Aminicenantes bacterium]|nr:hypothetical protein [Candidatus Aminicenantes bacterium]
MEELDLRHAFKKVQAPPGFERMVLARLHEVKAGSAPVKARSLSFKLTLAGGLAALLAGFVLINVFVFHQGGAPAGQAENAPGLGFAPGGVVQVMDSVDYGREVRNISGDPSTIYILEQVSDSGTYADKIY